jgi:hypothetical protein
MARRELKQSERRHKPRARTSWLLVSCAGTAGSGLCATMGRTGDAAASCRKGRGECVRREAQSTGVATRLWLLVGCDLRSRQLRRHRRRRRQRQLSSWHNILGILDGRLAASGARRRVRFGACRQQRSRAAPQSSEAGGTHSFVQRGRRNSTRQLPEQRRTGQSAAPRTQRLADGTRRQLAPLARRVAA